jgi:hypothetical protein
VLARSLLPPRPMRTLVRVSLLATAASLLLLACGGSKKSDGGSTPTPTPTPIPTAPPPPTDADLAGITVLDGWSSPRSLPAPVNTLGWEDSSNVSADGKTLYFSYTQYDPAALASNGSLVITGPARPGQKGPAFDIYEATIAGGTWNVADSTVNDPDPDLSEAASGVDVAQDRMVFVNFSTSGDLYLSDKVAGVWQPGVRMPSNVNGACVEDNPTLSADGKTVWFDSDRASANCATNGGPRQIFVTHDLGGGAWSDPVNVTPEAQPYAWQAFVTADGQQMLWSGVDDACIAAGPSGFCVFRASKASGDAWGTPAIEMYPVGFTTTGAVSTIGEVSVTADGHYLYFTYVRNLAGGGTDLSLGVATHL